MLRQPQELGDRAFLKAVYYPGRKLRARRPPVRNLGSFPPVNFRMLSKV